MTEADQYNEKYFHGGMGSHYDDYHKIRTIVYKSFKSIIEKISKMLSLDPSNLSILIIGAAYGYECKAAKDLGFDVICADISFHALREAKDIIDNMPALNTDIAALSVRRKAVDIVVAFNVLEHVSDPRRALREIACTTRKYAIIRLDNIFIIEIYNSLPKWLRKMLSKILRLPEILDTDVTHISQLPRYKWLQFFRLYGLEIIRFIGQSKYPLPKILNGFHIYIKTNSSRYMLA
jgi:2-polyprenyl-3-methyl-5-hydroxy-6-metoxy-1,4-benzoquinol methylase